MNLVTGIQQQCKISPHTIAMRQNQHNLDYQQLALKSGAIAQMIRTTGIQPGNRIALALDRGIDAVCCLLGVLATGCCYLPLDTNSPVKRQQFILKDADITAIIGRGECPDIYQQLNWLDFETASEYELDVTPVNPEQLAAILYTSGSTGEPKGIAISHRAILTFCNWSKQLVGLNKNDRIASLAPFFFDLSTFDIFACLSSGACINFVPKRLTMAPSQFSAWLSQHKISGIYTVPSVLSFLALKGNLSKTYLPDLRFVLFAGEVFATPVLKTLTAYLPDTRFYNFYGPTETNVCCYWEVINERLEDNSPIPIGNPACGNELKIKEENGELLVQGPTLMSGYWSQGSLRPPCSNQQWYATGDKVSINEYGEYCYHGRLDRMLKCSGFRVEPAEIEHTLKTYPGVVDCAVIGVNDETAGQRPAAALVVKPDTNISQLRIALQQQLPAYMIPARWKTLQALPLLVNGKVNYKEITNLFDPF